MGIIPSLSHPCSLFSLNFLSPILFVLYCSKHFLLSFTGLLYSCCCNHFIFSFHSLAAVCLSLSAFDSWIIATSYLNLFSFLYLALCFCLPFIESLFIITFFLLSSIKEYIFKLCVSSICSGTSFISLFHSSHLFLCSFFFISKRRKCDVTSLWSRMNKRTTLPAR